jgi:hypothetical protein
MTQDGEQRITKSVHPQRTDLNLASLKGTAALNSLEKLTLAARDAIRRGTFRWSRRPESERTTQ